MSQHRERDSNKKRIKIVMKSFPGCEPCIDIRKEVNNIAKNNPDIDIEFIEFKVSSKELENIKNPEHPVNKFFGTEHSNYAPITIIESDCKSVRLIGYNKGDIMKKIKEVECDGEFEEEDRAEEE